MTLVRRRVLVALLATVVAACGSTPTSPPPPPPPPPPPVNTPPSIDAMTAQGRRPRQPPRFAELRDVIDVTATVRDAETPTAQLVYQWSATAGTFSGTGSAVTWTAPDSAVTPATVTITLKVVETYGAGLSHEVSGTQTIALHNSGREVSDYAVAFLTAFSQPQTNKDWRSIMKDFKASACPQPGLVESEQEDVERHYTYFVMHTYAIQNPAARVDFGQGCSFRDRPGDACASVPVTWDSSDTRTGIRAVARGVNHVAAAYSTADSRWWLCSSDFEAVSALGHQLYRR